MLFVFLTYFTILILESDTIEPRYCCAILHERSTEDVLMLGVRSIRYPSGLVLKQRKFLLMLAKKLQKTFKAQTVRGGVLGAGMKRGL